MMGDWASPQALAWNIGTIGMTRSRSVTPSPAADSAEIACRYVERCE